MSDRYLGLVNSPIGSAVASRVGLPRPAVLRRYEPGAPLLPGPLLLGSTAGVIEPSVADALTSAGVDVRNDTSEPSAPTVPMARRPRNGQRSCSMPPTSRRPSNWPACASSSPARLRRLMPSGRVLVIARPPDGADVTVDASRQAIEGIVRSLAKELKRGSTANLLLVEGAIDAMRRWRRRCASSSPASPRTSTASRSDLVPVRLRRRATGTIRWPARPRSSPAQHVASAPRSPACSPATARR